MFHFCSTFVNCMPIFKYQMIKRTILMFKFLFELLVLVNKMNIQQGAIRILWKMCPFGIYQYELAGITNRTNV